MRCRRKLVQVVDVFFDNLAMGSLGFEGVDRSSAGALMSAATMYTPPCGLWAPMRRSVTGDVTQMSQEVCVAIISYCATAYVITAVQQGCLPLEICVSTGLRKQDSQTSVRFFARCPRWTVRRGGQGPDSRKARADPGARLNGPSWFRCRL